jgi:hypothetical protein
MSNTAKSFTTKSGVTYKLSRPWIGFWKKFNQFQAIAANLEELVANGGQVPEEFLEAFVEFVLVWVSRLQPDVTAETIEDCFDIADIPALMEIVNTYYTEVNAVSPPDSGATTTKRPRRQQ